MNVLQSIISEDRQAYKLKQRILNPISKHQVILRYEAFFFFFFLIKYIQNRREIEFIIPLLDTMQEFSDKEYILKYCGLFSLNCW